MGRDIVEARKARGWSQEELGDRAGVSQSVVSFAERGKATVAIHLVNYIRQALGLELVPEPPRPNEPEASSRRHLQGFGGFGGFGGEDGPGINHPTQRELTMCHVP